MIYCYVHIRTVYRKFLDFDFWFWNILAQRKLGAKLVKGIFKCFIIDIGFISCLTSIRLTYQGPIWVLFAPGDRVKLSCKSAKVPFCTAIDALLFRMTHFYLHKNLFFKARFFPNWLTIDISKTSLKTASVKCDASQEFSQNPVFIRGWSRTPTNI